MSDSKKIFPRDVGQMGCGPLNVLLFLLKYEIQLMLAKNIKSDTFLLIEEYKNHF